MLVSYPHADSFIPLRELREPDDPNGNRTRVFNVRG